MDITKDTSVEKLVEVFPGVVRLLILEGLPCVICGEPFWGSVGELAREKGWDEGRIDLLIVKMRTELGQAG